MGKKRRSVRQKSLFFTVVILAALLLIQFQNCSDIGLVHSKITQDSLPPDDTYKPAGEWDLCPKDNFYSDTTLYPSHPVGNGSTIDSGHFKNGTIMTFKMVVPQDAPQGRYQQAQFSESYGGANTGVWNISKKACDFNNPISDPRKFKPATTRKPAQPFYISGTTSSGIYFSYDYGLPGSDALLIIGETYYLNIRMDWCSRDGDANSVYDFCWFSLISFP